MNDITPGGSEVYRHTEPTGTEDVPEFDEALRTALEEHLARFLPGEPKVLHEIISIGVHLDVYAWAPTEEQPLWTLVTVGMSERAMNVPAGAEDMAHAELIMTLPGDWPIPSGNEAFQQVMQDDRIYWPIQTLKSAARLPSEFDTWLGFGHTVAAGENPSDTYPGSPYAGVMLAPATSLPPEALIVQHEGREVYLWGLYPLDEMEMDYKLQVGGEELFEAFLEEDYREGVLTDRQPLVAEAPRKKRGFLGGLFRRRT